MYTELYIYTHVFPNDMSAGLCETKAEFPRHAFQFSRHSFGDSAGKTVQFCQGMR